MSRLIHTAIALALFGGCPGLAMAKEVPSGAPLTGAQLEQMIGAAIILDADLPAEGAMSSIALGRHGWAFYLYVTPWGTGDQIKGKWFVAGDTLCWKFTGVSGDACYRHYPLSDGTFELWSVPEAQFAGTYRVRRPQHAGAVPAK